MTQFDVHRTKGRNREDSKGGGRLNNLIAGAFGTACFMYGKRQMKMVPMASGVLLCVYPYFTDNLFWLSVIGRVLLAAPFVIDA